MEKDKIKEDFLEAIDRADEEKVVSLLKTIKQFPRDYPVYMVDTALLDESSKVRSYPLHFEPNNESMHPYIKDFFDWGIRNYYEEYPVEYVNFYRSD